VNRYFPAVISCSGISIIVLAILIGPLFSPPEFSWIQHSTSEQAGQHMTGAWIMRFGFIGYGAATLTAALVDWSSRPFVRAALALFGLGLLGTAIWSNTSILPGVSSDIHEDWMHSVASGVVGTAFAAACAARLLAPGGTRRDMLAWGGLVVSVVFPLAMIELPELRGLIQRIMFGVSLMFVAREFVYPHFRQDRTQ
jgi:hypothetical protein